MSWSDDIRCLFCDGRLPLYRKITYGQFCSSAHRKAYWQEQERLAIERLHQTHNSLQAYRELVPVDISSVRKPQTEAPYTQPLRPFLPEPEDWAPSGQDDPQVAASQAVPPAPPADPPYAGYLRETQNAAHYWTARATWEIEPVGPRGAAAAVGLPWMPGSGPANIDPCFKPALPPMCRLDVAAACAGEFPGSLKTVFVEAVEFPLTAYVPVLAASGAGDGANLPAQPDPPFAGRMQRLEPGRAHDAAPAGDFVTGDLSFAEPSLPALLAPTAGALHFAGLEAWQAVCAAQPMELEPALEAPMVERTFPLDPGVGVDSARWSSAWPAEPASPFEFPQRACLPLGQTRPSAGEELASAELAPFAPTLTPASGRRMRCATVVPAPLQIVLARQMGAFRAEGGLPYWPSAPMAGQVPYALRPDPRPGVETRITAEPAFVPLRGLEAYVANDVVIDCVSQQNCLTPAGAVDAHWVPPAAAILELPFLEHQRAANQPHAAMPLISPSLAAICSLPQPPKLAPMLPRLRCEVLDAKPVSDAFPSAVPEAMEPAPAPARASAAMPAVVPPDTRPAAIWKHATDFWQHAPRDLRLLVFAIPALLALVFHPSVFPKVSVRAPQNNPIGNILGAQLANVKRTLVDRAAVALDDDFRSGLDSWQSRGNYTAAWTFDATGFVQPGPLALYQPSMGLTDYQMQFLGMIDQKALSWVVRASDFENYYVLKLVVLKPGPLPEIGLTRYAVIDGKAQDRADTIVPISARADMLYRVRLDISGDDYVLDVQGHVADTWSEHHLHRGGIGFFSARGEQSSVRWVQVTHQYDMLGRLCAYLAPYNIPTNGSW